MIHALALALVLLAVSPSAAPSATLPPPPIGSAVSLPPQERGVKLDDRLGAPVPRDLTFRDQDGKLVKLGSFLGHGRPVIVYLGYSRCTMLCDVAQSALAKTLPDTGLALGRDYDVVTVSIDPHETPEQAAKARAGHLQSMGISAAKPVWPFLVGDIGAIGKLADALGDHFRYDASSGQFVHAAVFFLVTPDGRLSKDLNGLPDSPKDLRLALVEASQGKIGTLFEQLQLICWHYDPSTRKYGWTISFILKGGALATMGSLGTLLGVLWWRDFRRDRKERPGTEKPPEDRA